MTEMDHEKRNRLERVYKYPRTQIWDGVNNSKKASINSNSIQGVYVKYATKENTKDDLVSGFHNFVFDPHNYKITRAIARIRPKDIQPEGLPDDVWTGVQIRLALRRRRNQERINSPEYMYWHEEYRLYRIPSEEDYSDKSQMLEWDLWINAVNELVKQEELKLAKITRDQKLRDFQRGPGEKWDSDPR